jgi:hypothetical protein
VYNSSSDTILPTTTPQSFYSHSLGWLYTCRPVVDHCSVKSEYLNTTIGVPLLSLPGLPRVVEELGPPFEVDELEKLSCLRSHSLPDLLRID